MTVLEELIQYEETISNDQNAKTEFVIERGELPVLFSAPHAVKHFRNHQWKPAELYTGAIVRYVSRTVGCHAIYSTRCEEANPNYDDNEISAYKKELKRYVEQQEIKLVIDFHGCLERNPAAIEIGTMDDCNRSLHGCDFIVSTMMTIFARVLAKHLQKYQKSILRNQRFLAANPNTVTNYISSSSGIPCVQLEINRLFRDCRKPECMLDLVKSLTEVGNTLARQMGL